MNIKNYPAKRIISLKPVSPGTRIISLLEKRGLIRTLKPTQKILNNKNPNGAMDIIYKASERFGSHKLVAIVLGRNSSKIRLNYHSDNEDFLIISTASAAFKPFYIVMALHKKKVIERKIKCGTVSAEDFIALRIPYNDPKISVFTMLKDTVHCEATITAEKGRYPIFFVSEPSRLKMQNPHFLNLNISL